MPGTPGDSFPHGGAVYSMLRSHVLDAVTVGVPGATTPHDRGCEYRSVDLRALDGGPIARPIDREVVGLSTPPQVLRPTVIAQSAGAVAGNQTGRSRFRECFEHQSVYVNVSGYAAAVQPHMSVRLAAGREHPITGAVLGAPSASNCAAQATDAASVGHLVAGPTGYIKPSLGTLHAFKRTRRERGWRHVG